MSGIIATIWTAAIVVALVGVALASALPHS